MISNYCIVLLYSFHFQENHKLLIAEQSRYDGLEHKLSTTLLEYEAEKAAAEEFFKFEEKKEQELKTKIQQLKMETSTLSRNLITVSFVYY